MTDENTYLDGLFQSKFSGFEAEPPAGVWNNIHSELHGKGGGSVNPVNLASLAALLLISGLLGFSIIKDAPNASNIDPAQQENNLMLLADHFETDIPSEDLTAVADQTLVSNPLPQDNLQPSTNTENIISEKETPNTENTSHTSVHQQQSSGNYGADFSEQTRLNRLKARRSLNLNTTLQAPSMHSISVRDSKYRPKFAGVNDGERQYLRRAAWQLGVFFTPQMTYYPDDPIANQRAYTVDVSAKWIKNEFFIESGLGVSFSSDNGKYAIDYEPYLGTYDDVYNVTFDTLPSGDIQPTYHTNPVDVYDTISKFRVEQVKNNYTYLQIPLYVGFQKQVNRFGWFVKGGPIFNVLLTQNIPTPIINNDRIVDMDDNMPMRVKTHWQFAVSAGFNYQLSDKVSISVEPTFRYYLNSQYERKYITTRHPYSIGLRTGLLFNF